MPYELNEIKKIRKSLGLTQTDLAKRANVSQSLIAKIESGKIDPTFTKTKRIFETLNDLEKKEEIKAEELMKKKIISVAPDNDIKDSINKMKRFGISQILRLDQGKHILPTMRKVTRDVYISTLKK